MFNFYAAVYVWSICLSRNHASIIKCYVDISLRTLNNVKNSEIVVDDDAGDINVCDMVRWYFFNFVLVLLEYLGIRGWFL